MPDETATIDSPSGAPVDTALKDFGNLNDVFDKAFPATAPKEGAKTDTIVSESRTTPDPVIPAQSVDTPAAPAQSAPDPVADLLPNELFGEVKKEEPKKEIPIPEGLTKPKDIQTWKELRQRLDTAETDAAKFRTEAAEYRQKIEAVQPDLLQARLSETEKINKELSDRISLVDLRIHPEFQRQFDQPIEKERQNAVELAKSAGIEPLELQQALRLPHGPARTEALDDIVGNITSPSVQAELGAVLKSLNTLERSRVGALADAKGNWDRLQEYDKAERHRHIEQEQKQLTSVADELQKSFAEEHKIAFFRKVDGNEKWNAAIDQEHQLAIDISTKSKDHRQIIGAIRMGVAAPRMYNTIIALRKEMQKLRAENAEFKSADPSLGGGREEAAAETEQEKGLSFAEAVSRGSGLR